MSDDTATVERRGEMWRVFCPKHDEFDARYTTGRPLLDDTCPQCLIEQQARTIAELRENGDRLVRAADSWKEQCLEQQATIAELREQLKRESDRTTYTVTLLDPLFGEGNNKPVEALVRGVVKTIAEQAARLEAMERDARRLDFVDEHFYRMPIAKDPLGWHLIVGYPSLGDYKLIGTFREAIDAAIDGAKTD